MTQVFPERRWGSETSPLRRPLTAFACSGPGSWAIRTLAPLDRRILHSSGGRYTMLGPISAPTMLLTTTGRRSGQPRTSPLLYHREDPDLYVVGSNFGQEHHPAWTWNLLAHPECSVNTAGIEVAATATPVVGAERDRVYAEFERLVRVYSVYRGRTDRPIRVFRLTAT